MKMEPGCRSEVSRCIPVMVATLSTALFGFLQYEVERLALKIAGHLDLFFTHDSLEADVDGVAHLNRDGKGNVVPVDLAVGDRYGISVLPDHAPVEFVAVRLEYKAKSNVAIRSRN